eukprot:TRINITY_DN3202_c0_g1_i4.p1 TRINITY_DN3202_c0_g1~~TRINITY_DN3202_c0_g1_i4.p1  ORF type:complete len:118 (+),score=22.55 TRINITY_DN3202_c0_g1_i4:33-356(+)
MGAAPRRKLGSADHQFNCAMAISDFICNSPRLQELRDKYHMNGISITNRFGSEPGFHAQCLVSVNWNFPEMKAALRAVLESPEFGLRPEWLPYLAITLASDPTPALL